MMPSRKSTSAPSLPLSASVVADTSSLVASAHSCMRSRSTVERSRIRPSEKYRKSATTAADAMRKAALPYRRMS